VYNYAGDSPIGNIDLHGLQQFSAVDYESRLAIEAAAMVGSALEGAYNTGLSFASWLVPESMKARVFRSVAEGNNNLLPSWYSDQQMASNFELKYSFSKGHYIDRQGGILEETIENTGDALDMLSMYGGGGGPVLAAKLPGGLTHGAKFALDGIEIKALDILQGTGDLGWYDGETLFFSINSIQKSLQASKNEGFSSLISYAEDLARQAGLQNVRIEFGPVMNGRLHGDASWAQEYGYYFSSNTDNLGNKIITWEKSLK
jgi:hypothetical protein